MDSLVPNFLEYARAFRHQVEDFEEFYPFYEQIEKYRRAIAKYAGKEYLKIVTKSWRTEVEGSLLRPSGLRDALKIPMATFYVRSHVLKSRIACPVYIRDSNNTYHDLYVQYMEQVTRPLKWKEVLPKAFRERKEKLKDHFLGLIADGTITSTQAPVVLSVENRLANKTCRLRFAKQIKIGNDAVTSGEIARNTLDSVKRKLQSFSVHGTQFDRNQIGRLIGVPLQFVSAERIFRQRNQEGKYFYPSRFDWPLAASDWMAMHLLYFMEEPALLCSSGCTIMLVELAAIGTNVARTIGQRIESAFVPVVKAGMALSLSQVIGPLEQSILEKKLLWRPLGSSMRYPDDFAVQSNAAVPKMPLLDILKQMKKGILGATSKHLADCLRFLVEGEESLTTGYDNIAQPLFNCVQRLWFRWQKSPSITDLDSKLSEWNNEFESIVKKKERTLDELDSRLLQVIKMALGTEHHMADFPSYREHFVHSFHVFCLGLCVLETLSHAHPRLFSGNRLGRTVKLWFFASFWHDVSYSVQMLDELSNWYVASIQRRKFIDRSDPEFIPIRPSYGHLLMNDRYLGELQHERSTYLWPAIASLFSDIDEDIRTVRQACKEQLLEKAQHGVLSSLIFLHDCEELKESHGLTDSEISTIAVAIMMHHIKGNESSSGNWFQNEPTADRLLRRWRDDPWIYANIIPTMLVICDCLAQWGRNFEFANSEKCQLEELSFTNRQKKQLRIHLHYPTLGRTDCDARKWYKTIFDPEENTCKIWCRLIDLKVTDREHDTVFHPRLM